MIGAPLAWRLARLQVRLPWLHVTGAKSVGLLDGLLGVAGILIVIVDHSRKFPTDLAQVNLGVKYLLKKGFGSI